MGINTTSQCKAIYFDSMTIAWKTENDEVGGNVILKLTFAAAAFMGGLVGEIAYVDKYPTEVFNGFYEFFRIEQ